MLKGFRDFLLRGNVIDLAVAVVVGGAFTAIVKSFNDAIIQPLLSRVGANDHKGHGILQVSLGGAPGHEQFLRFDDLLSAGISFIITAAVVYFLIVLPYQSIKKRLVKPEDAEKSETDLLAEIRDLLAEQKKAS